MAGAALGNRGARGLEPLLELHPAVRPARAGEVDNRRQAAAPVVRGEGPVVFLVGPPVLLPGAERLQPGRRDLAADGVEAEALEVVAVGDRLVDPGVLRRVAGTGLALGERWLVVDDRAEEVARLPVHEEVAVGRDVERHRPGGHQQRGVALGGRREERLGGRSESRHSDEKGKDGSHAADCRKNRWNSQPANRGKLSARRSRSA